MHDPFQKFGDLKLHSVECGPPLQRKSSVACNLARWALYARVNHDALAAAGCHEFPRR